MLSGPPRFLIRSEKDLKSITVGEVVFQVLWGQHKIEKLSFSYSDESGENHTRRVRQAAVIDVLCLLAQGRSRPAFAQLTLREIENYLREKPEVPLWDEQVFTEMHQWFRQLKAGLLGGLETMLMQDRLYAQSDLGDIIKLTPQEWRVSNMMARIRWVEHHLERFIRPILSADGGGVALIDVDDDSIVLSFKGVCGHCRGGRAGTLQFIQHFFFTLSSDSVKLKVVDEEPFLEAF